MAKQRTSGKVKAGVIAAGGLIAVGMYLAGDWNGPGAGGEGEGFGSTTDSSAVTLGEGQPAVGAPGEAPDLPLPEQREPGAAPDGITQVDDALPASEPQEVGPPETVTIEIREEEYLVSIDGRPSQVMTLEEIGKLAGETTGSANGIRVRLQYHTSARGLDENRLLQTLQAADIAGEAIQKLDTPVGEA